MRQESIPTYQLAFAVLCFFLLGCGNNMLEKLANAHKSAVSPDGNRLAYITGECADEKCRYHVITFYNKGFSSGGSGIFIATIKQSETIDLSWDSDSLLIISYPQSAVIEKKSEKDFSFGTEIEVKYKIAVR